MLWYFVGHYLECHQCVAVSIPVFTFAVVFIVSLWYRVTVALKPTRNELFFFEDPEGYERAAEEAEAHLDVLRGAMFVLFAVLFGMTLVAMIVAWNKLVKSLKRALECSRIQVSPSVQVSPPQNPNGASV